MMESPHESSYQLTTVQELMLRDYATAKISPETIDPAYTEYLTEIKRESGAALSVALTNPEINDSVALLIDEVNNESAQKDSLATLFAYMSVYDEARQTYPGRKLPERFLKAVQTLALEHNEITIATDLQFDLMLSSGFLDANDMTGAKRVEEVPLSFPIMEITAEKTDRMVTINDMAELNLSQKVQATKNQLSKLLSHECVLDNNRLRQRKGAPLDLFNDISHGRFHSVEGLEAAKAQQDYELLELRTGEIDTLFNDLINERFTTEEGRYAAETKHDRERLNASSDDHNKLYQNILSNRFLTEDGVAAAKAMQDSLRLQACIKDPINLFAEIKRGLFLTPEGKADAETQHDADLLSLHATDTDKLQNDVIGQHFFSQEALAKALEIIEKGRNS
jgi:hypothetical protein